MLDVTNFTAEYIRELQRSTKRDPGLLERTIFAFGALEALARVGTPFRFKGGTSLMMLLDRPRRISTDIDILVNGGTDIDAYITEAAKLFPFKAKEEQIRTGRDGIVKRHFKFIYDSPTGGREFYILLDVLFDDNHYESTQNLLIENALLKTVAPDISVEVPTVSSMLGDKLTAFAPHTTGIPFGIGKELEIIKQFFDVATLIDASPDIAETKKTYQRVYLAEASYRGIEGNWEDGLRDTIRACACIAGRGAYDADEFRLFMQGIDAIRGHIFDEKYSGEIAASQACKVMYLASCLLSDTPTLKS